MRLRRICSQAVLCGAILALPAQARAEFIDFTGLGHAAVVDVRGLLNARVWAGEINWVWVGTPPDGFDAAFYTYCVDITHVLTDPQQVTIRSSSELAPATGGGGKVAWLLNTYAPAIRAGGTNTQAAALQVAIWEALYDTVPSLTSGSFYLASTTTSAIRTQAQSYLAALYSGPGGYYTSTAVWLDSPRGQDQILLVAEPSGILLLAGGALFFRRRLLSASRAARDARA
ncbi:MAG TPA: hypothetical protein VNI83_04360 [Vicinamibacterales bacterium]|nr:hypothetical protein [Vicinamibacterales bacterium]